MSYNSERNAGFRITLIRQREAEAVLSALGFKNFDSHIFTNNTDCKYGNDKYTLRNISMEGFGTASIASYSNYNLQDVIAIALAAGKSYEDISDALNRHTHMGSWTPERVKTNNQRVLPGMQALVDKINETNPNAQARIVTTTTDSLNYKYTLYYKKPGTNSEVFTEVDPKALKINSDGNVSDADVTNWLNSTAVGSYVNQSENADKQIGLSDAVKNKFEQNPNLGTEAVTNQTLSQSDQDKVIAQTPGTDNLHIWNRDKDKNIIGAVLDAIPGVNTNVPDQNKQREAFDHLQELINSSTEESVSSTIRDVNAQRKQLLNQIRNDPATYRAVMQQLRADHAAGTIAGQRAANVNTVLSEQDANYNAAADELYSSLFGKDNNIVDTTRQDVFDAKASGLDIYITDRLNAANQDAKARIQAANNFGTLVDTMISGLDVEKSKYQNAADLAGAAADAETTYLVESIKGLASADRATQDAALKLITDNLGLGESYLNAVADGSTTVTDALDEIIADIENGKINVDNWHASPGLVEMLGGEAISEKVKPVVYDNTQYNDAVNNTKFSEYVDNLPALMKTYTPEEILQLYGLGDYLTKAGLEAQYGNFSADANKQADQVFNAAQRAYIASITAGDVKTAEQLTRLAQTSTGAKRNLNAAAALAKQYSQQFDSATTGLRLSSDYLNKQSKNKNFVTDNQLAANAKYNTYWGNGNDTYDKSTVNAVTNAFNDAGILFKANAGAYGNKLMSTTQDLNTTNNGLSVNNINRLSTIANTTSGENFTNLVNNITNENVRQSALTRAKAMGLQGQQTKNELNNK